MKEMQFETELIQYLTTGRVTPEETADGLLAKEPAGDYCIKTKLWRYEPEIKTTEQLWQNFKEILERHNQDKLEHPLSVVEFNQVKKKIMDISTPYEAGQFLYGLNGVSQIEIDLDEGRLEVAKKFGATSLVNSTDGKAVEKGSSLLHTATPLPSRPPRSRQRARPGCS